MRHHCLYLFRLHFFAIISKTPECDNKKLFTFVTDYHSIMFANKKITLKNFVFCPISLAAKIKALEINMTIACCGQSNHKYYQYIQIRRKENILYMPFPIVSFKYQRKRAQHFSSFEYIKQNSMTHYLEDYSQSHHLELLVILADFT